MVYKVIESIMLSMLWGTEMNHKRGAVRMLNHAYPENPVRLLLRNQQIVTAIRTSTQTAMERPSVTRYYTFM